MLTILLIHGYKRWVLKIADVKNIRLSVKTFTFYRKMGLHPFRRTFWPDKWNLRERYGRFNLDEKEF